MEREWKTRRNQMIVKTIVTSDLLDKMAESFNVACPNTLTGFKFIAALIKELEGKKQFIGGGEESYGYMINDFVRDKDAIASCAMLAEMTAWAKDQGMTVFELLAEIYSQFGFYLEHLISITKKGMRGAEEIQEMMKNFRSNPPATLDGSEVITVMDYQSSVETNLKTGDTKPIDLPKSNVLQFLTADGTKVSARPSGTEPKIKFYTSVNTALTDKADYLTVKAELSEHCPYWKSFSPMMQTSLQALFDRDLNRALNELSSYNQEENLWKVEGAITNTAGNLFLHLLR